MADRHMSLLARRVEHCQTCSEPIADYAESGGYQALELHIAAWGKMVAVLEIATVVELHPRQMQALMVNSALVKYPWEGAQVAALAVVIVAATLSCTRT